jgi:hypothetical protein
LGRRVVTVVIGAAISASLVEASANDFDPNASFREGELAAGGSERSDGQRAIGGAPFHFEVQHPSSAIGDCLDGVREIVFRVWDDGSGRRELVYAGCPRVATSGAPAPPTAGEVRDAVAIPDPTIATNPQAKTLAGMRTDYWYTGPTERTVTVELNGFTVTAIARATSYRWQFGDGAERTTTVPGSKEQPATTHAYRDRGTTTITLTVTWTGSFTFSGPGGVTGSGDLGSQAFTSSRALIVQEVQPVGSTDR